MPRLFHGSDTQSFAGSPCATWPRRLTQLRRVAPESRSHQGRTPARKQKPGHHRHAKRKLESQKRTRSREGRGTGRRDPFVRFVDASFHPGVPLLASSCAANMNERLITLFTKHPKRPSSHRQGRSELSCGRQAQPVVGLVPFGVRSHVMTEWTQSRSGPIALGVGRMLHLSCADTVRRHSAVSPLSHTLSRHPPLPSSLAWRRSLVRSLAA